MEVKTYTVNQVIKELAKLNPNAKVYVEIDSLEYGIVDAGCIHEEKDGIVFIKPNGLIFYEGEL